MFHPSSALIVYLNILKLLDAGANTLDKLGRCAGSSQDIIEVEHAVQALKDAESKQDASSAPPTSHRASEIKQTEPEKTVQHLYERVKKFADRLIPALQPYKRTRTSSSGKSGDSPKREKGETEKLRRELETIRLECARSLIQLLSE
jgi:hypothetical protein